MKKIWAIARITIAQCIRTRVAMVLVFFLLIMVPALPFLLKSSDSLVDQMRVIVTYCMYLIILLMSILTVFLSCGVLAREVKEKQIFMLDPKPIPRWQILVGKWLGVTVLNAALLLVMGGASYGILRYLGGSQGEPQTQEEAMAKLKVENTMLVARGSVRPDIPDIEDKVTEVLKEREQQGLTLTTRTRAWHREGIRNWIIHRGFRLPPHHPHKWVISGLPTDLKPTAWIWIRFKHWSSDRRQGVALRTIPGEWTIGAAEEGCQLVRQTIAAPSGAINEFPIPSGTVSRDGTLTIEYVNRHSNVDRVARFPYDSGLEIRYPVRSLEMNFVAGLGLIFLWTAFLAILGLAAASCLGFPVATFFSMVMLAISLSLPLWEDLSEDVFIFDGDRPPGSVELESDVSVQNILKKFLLIFPDFRRYNPVPNLVEGLVVPKERFLVGVVLLIIIRGGSLAALGAYLFYRRELAAEA